MQPAKGKPNPVITYHEWVNALREFEIPAHYPVLVHACPDLTYESRGGAKTTLTALLSVFDDIMLPAFTHKTVITPAAGPGNNGMVYSTSADNSLSEVFNLALYPDTELGKLPQILLKHPDARRSMHPVLSFAGIGLDSALAAQRLDGPFNPIEILAELNGWILLLGVDHKQNSAIHAAERLAGRKQFIGWALTQNGVVECNNMPGCTEGFNAAGTTLAGYCRETMLGDYRIQAYPAGPLLQVIAGLIKHDPLKLLCASPKCLPCNAVRHELTLK